MSEDDAETVTHFKGSIGYFIAYKDFFATWITMGKDFDVSNVCDALSAFNRLISPNHKKVFYRLLNEAKMAGYTDYSGRFIQGIEGYLPSSQYERPKHREKVVEDILDHWLTLSQNGKFHALFATSSIPEDYNARYGQDFSIPTHANFKKDVAAGLAHKSPHRRIEKLAERQIDLLIVVEQMFTGFDSKWINALYLDKLLLYENTIQAFSRTNRLFGPDRPFGTVHDYRLPHTMESQIQEAVKLFSGDKPLGLFVDRLPENLRG